MSINKLYLLLFMFLILLSINVLADCAGPGVIVSSPQECCRVLAYISKHENGTYQLKCGGLGSYVLGAGDFIYATRSLWGLVTEDDWNKIQSNELNITGRSMMPYLDRVWQSFSDPAGTIIQIQSSKGGNVPNLDEELRNVWRIGILSQTQLIWSYCLALITLVADFIILIFYIVIIRIVMWIILILIPGAFIKIRDKMVDAYIKARWNT